MGLKEYREFVSKKRTPEEVREFLSDEKNRDIVIKKGKEAAKLLYPEEFKEKYKTLTIRMPRKLHEALKEFSFFSGISINQIMLDCIGVGIKEWEPEKLSDADEKRFNEYKQTDMYKRTYESIKETIFIIALMEAVEVVNRGNHD